MMFLIHLQAHPPLQKSQIHLTTLGAEVVGEVLVAQGHQATPQAFCLPGDAPYAVDLIVTRTVRREYTWRIFQSTPRDNLSRLRWPQAN